MTEYVVLSFNEIEGNWSQRTTELASSSNAAIRKYLETVPGAANSEFVAVPTRSWKPVAVKTETKTQLRFS